VVFFLGETVIQHFTTILTLCVTILHAGLGCCWHHVHTHESSSASHEHADTASEIVVSQCPHHDVSGTTSGDVHFEPSNNAEKQHPDDHGQCDEERCVYMAAPRTEMMPCNEYPISISDPSACATLLAGTLATASPSVLDECLSLRRKCALAPRWTQVWLI